MSKVKITGNASGTGVFTIEAPGTNDPRTLTLPDSTGTLLDENSSLPAANLTGTVADARISTLTASKLSGDITISAGDVTMAGSLTVGSMNWSAVARVGGSSQSIPHATDTIVAFHTSTYDTLSESDATTRFTATVAGYYIVNTGVRYANYTWPSTKHCGISIRKNNQAIAGHWNKPPAIATSTSRSVSTGVYLAVNDQIEITVYHQYGSAINMNPGCDTFFTVNRIA